ncbi:hypothetical protein [Streptomyces sp. NBC_00102]|uniref:hypothetical protein n=1 Tax=Streptomyces sp. NBC_00102 TaxID=2975652 RepID=UPI002B1D8333|nr:hypothetical protein [Streptomyces sp. NBC_00102]
MANAKARVDAGNLLPDDSPELTAMSIRTKARRLKQRGRGALRAWQARARHHRADSKSVSPTAFTAATIRGVHQKAPGERGMGSHCPLGMA